LNYKDINSTQHSKAMNARRAQMATRRQVVTLYIRHGLLCSQRLRQSEE
jgi:hypothetical protein